MKVTDVIEVTSARSKVYIDNEFAFVLYKGELRIYKIFVGAELGEESYRSIMEEVLPKRAKIRALNLLKTRDYSKKALMDKLLEGGYPEIIATLALEYVESYGYIDDLRYAIHYITCMESSRSRKRIEQDLFQKGIDRETIAKAWLEWEDEGNEKDEISLIKALIEKKHFDPETADIKEKQRLLAFLMRKGFNMDQVRKALDINMYTV